MSTGNPCFTLHVCTVHIHASLSMSRFGWKVFFFYLIAFCVFLCISLVILNSFTAESLVISVVDIRGLIPRETTRRLQNDTSRTLQNTSTALKETSTSTMTRQQNTFRNITAKIYRDKVPRTIYNDIPFVNETLNKVHISVKSTKKYHLFRLPILLLTWFQTVPPKNVSPLCAKP